VTPDGCSMRMATSSRRPLTDPQSLKGMLSLLKTPLSLRSLMVAALDR
jgi:hypothetical protein